MFVLFYGTLVIVTHTRLNGPLSGTTRVSRYQRGKTSLDFTEAKRRWVAVASAGLYATLHLAPDRQPCQHPTSPPLSFLQTGCPSCRPTNSVKALNAHTNKQIWMNKVCRLIKIDMINFIDVVSVVSTTCHYNTAQILFLLLKYHFIGL